jgi:hypothetical protein
VAGLLDEFKDYAGDLGGSVTQAAGAYVKGYVSKKLAANDKAANPNAQPPASVGSNGTGGSVAVVPKTSVLGLPTWSIALLAASGGLLSLALVMKVLK